MEIKLLEREEREGEVVFRLQIINRKEYATATLAKLGKGVIKVSIQGFIILFGLSSLQILGQGREEKRRIWSCGELRIPPEISKTAQEIARFVQKEVAPRQLELPF